MAGRLPKVTEYIKNMGKSVGYAAIETITEPTENMKDFIDTNDELFKTIYAATRNYRQTLKAVDRSIKRSKVYEAATLGLKALQEDITTGKFYNKERENQFGMEGVMGDDFSDFSEFESDDFGNDWGSEDNDEDVSESTKATIASTRTISGMISASSEAETKAIVGSAKAIADVNMASTKLLSMQNEKIYSSLVNGFAGVGNGVALINSILSGPLTNYMNESVKFYGDISNKVSETNAYLKELTEMQRNLYKVQQEEYKSTKYDEIVSASGAPDLVAYAKNIYKNLLNLDPTGGMLSGSDGNMLKVFVGSPLKAIPMMVAKMLIPSIVQTTLKSFDENMSGLFSAFAARMNSWAEEESIDGINFKGIIGNLLGIKMDKKTSVDTSKYQRGPIPFDGETKKAIVDVIPQYLARIESAVSGRPAQYYDGASGKYKTMREIHREYKQNQEAAWAQSISSIEDSFNKWADMFAKTAAEREELNKRFKKLGKQVYNDGGDFTPYMGYGPRGDRRNETNPYNMAFGYDEWTSFVNYLRDHDKKGVYNIAANTFNATQNRTRYMKSIEGSFANPASLLFNGGMLEFDDHGKLKRFDPNKGGPGEYYKKSNKFKSATDYLKDILAEVRYIRTYGLRGGSGKGNKGNYRPKGDFDKFYKENGFEEDTTIEDPWVDPNRRHTFQQRKAPKEKTAAEKLGITKENVIREFDSAKTVTDKWQSMKKGVDKLLRSPALWITDIIQKADQRIYDAMFGTEDGETFSDKAGRPYRSFLDYMVSRTSDIFDEFENRMRKMFNDLYGKFKETKVGKWVDEKSKAFARSVGGRLKSKLGWAKNRAMQGLDDTYGTLFESLRAGRILSAEDAKQYRNTRRSNAANYQYLTDLLTGQDTSYSNTAVTDFDEMTELLQGLNNPEVQNLARGGIVSKYGLAMVSPGEIIIPNRGRKTQQKNLMRENREKGKILSALRGGKIGNYAQGTVNNNSKTNDASSSLWKAIRKVMGEVSGDGADIAADALIGSGVSLITGLFGGPLLGAAAGAGIGIVKNSETAKKYLFGEMDENGNRKGGLIPKSVIEFFNKNSKGMIDFGIGGAIAGLFTPLGLVGGALAGATLGWAKNTDAFKEFMFGSVEKGTNGLMTKETQEKIKKALPAMGIGATAGIFFGPFGLVGNAMLGAAGGYVASTDKFKEAIFGKEDKDGKKHGGLLGALKDGFINPLLNTGKKIAFDLKDYAKKYIIDPTKTFLKGSGQFIRNIFISVGDRIADGVNGVFEKHLGIPLGEWFREKVFKRASSLIGGVAKALTYPARFAVSLPFRALGGIGNNLISRQIARGTMDTMTAKQRLEFRKKHKIRSGTKIDRTKQLDEMLAGSSLEELQSMTDNMDTFIKNRGSKNIAFNNMIDRAGGAVSDLFDANGVWAKRGHAPLVNAINDKKHIMQALRRGDINAVRKILEKDGLGPNEIEEFLQSINADQFAGARQAMIDESGLDADAIDRLEKITGYGKLHKGGNRWVKQMRRLMGTELKSRQAEEAGKTPEQKALEQQQDSSTKIIDLLTKINENIANVGRTKITDSGKVIRLDENNKPEDGKDAQDALQEQEERDETQEEIAENMGTVGGFFSHLIGLKKGDQKKKDKPSLISRLLGRNKEGGVGGTLLDSAFGGKLKIAKMIGLGALGFSGLGWASQFLKEKVGPWFTQTLLPQIQQSKFYQGIKERFDKFVGSIKDGSLFESLANKFVQGTVFAMKNITIPLTAAVVKTLPKIGAGIVSGILSGLWDAIKGIFKQKTQTTDTDISKDFNSTLKNLPVGSEESNFAKSFSGKTISSSANYSFDNIAAINNKTFTSNALGTGSTHKITNVQKYDAAGTYTNDNGSTSVVDENGEVTVYDQNGTMIGAYDQNSGNITTTHAAVEKESGASNLIKNGLVRGFATGKESKIFGALSRAGSALTGVGKKILSNPLGKLPGIKGTGKIAKILGGAGTTVGNIVNGANKIGTKLYDASHALYSNNGIVADKLRRFGSNLTNAGLFRSGAANASWIEKGFGGLEKKFGTFFEKLAGSPVMKAIVNGLGKVGKYATKANTSLVKLFPKLGEKIGTLAASGNLLAKGGSKVLNAVGGLTPLAIGFWLYSFEEGMSRCETILGVAKDTKFEITPGVRVLTGLVKAINDNLLFGLIPIDKVMDIIIDNIGDVIGIDKEELEEAQKETAELLTKSSIETGEEVTLGMYNNQGNIFSRVYRWATGQSNKYRVDMKDNSTNTSSTGSSTGGKTLHTAGRGRGRGGSQGDIFAGMRYGNSTIGQSGCAPVAASMLMNGNVPEAARFAQATGHVASDGSTDIGFFNDYFSAKGISNRTTTSKSDVSSALKHGQQAVLLGQDPNGGDNSAYSKNSHFITARGMDRNGNVIVDDPELGRRKMSSSKVFSNMKASVITGRGRYSQYRGRGLSDDAASPNAAAVVNAAKSQIGTTANKNNNCKYNQEYREVTGGGNLNDPWCCKFVWWSFRHAGASALFYGGNPCASSTTLMNFYKKKGRMVSTNNAQAGDIIFMNFKHDDKNIAYHVGIVTGPMNGGKIPTVEGNTNQPGRSGDQTNGHGVWEKNRSTSDIVGIARPEYAGATLDPSFAGSYSEFDTSGNDTTTTGLFGALKDLGASIMKGIYGESAYNAIAGTSDDSSSTSTSIMSNADNNGNLSGNSNAEKIWTYLRSLGYSKEGTAAIMGSLEKESGLLPNNLQNSYNTKFGLTDDQYTTKVNNGSYSKDKFVNDSGGYGLAQWTFSSRKQKLYDQTIGAGKPINDLKSQLDLLDSEVQTGGLTNSIKNANNISAANDVWISQFERPAGYKNKGSALYTGRLSAANNYFNQFKGTGRSTDSFVNKYPTASKTTTTAVSGNMSSTDMLKLIVQALLTIAQNTQSIDSIYEILSKNGIDVSSATNGTTTEEEAKKSINRLMSSKTDADTVTNILQTKNTGWLVEAMSKIARE